MSTCPVCRMPMVSSVVDGVTVDDCNAHGTWLDQGELLAITNAERFRKKPLFEDLFRREVSPPRRDDRTLECPSCTTAMEPIVYHGVTIDRCREHGVWLDAGEMAAILNNLRLDPQYMRGVALRIADREL